METGDTLDRAMREHNFEDVYLRLENKKELPMRTSYAGKHHDQNP